MEEDKANPSSSQPATPVPSGLQDQTLSWHLVGAESASVRPQRDTEEEQGPFVIKEAERKPGMDEEPCQGRDTRPQELRLWEEATGRELSQWVPAGPVQDVSLCGVWSHQGLNPWKMGVSVQWGDGAQQMLYQWEQRVKIQELPQGKEEGNDPKLSQQGEGRVRGQEADRGSLLAGKGSEERTSAGDNEDCQYHTQLELSQECQGAAKPELSQGEVSSSQDPSDGDDGIEPEPCHAELNEWEEYIYREVSIEEDGSDRDLTQSTWQYTCIFSFGVPPSLPKAAAWDGLGVLELREEGGRRSLAALAADGLPAPVPREAWAERRARQPLCASLFALRGRAATGPAACPVLAWQEPGPAPRSPRGPSAAQPAAPSKRPGRLRRALRALRALFRCRCLAPRTRE